MFAGPWVRIQGNPLLLFNVVERRFSILGQIFWPQDSGVFAVAMLVFISGIAVFTVAFGRLWCGWTCPQTVIMEMVFRKVEYLIDGDSAVQRALAAAPWTLPKMARRLFKHAVFFGLSFLVASLLVSRSDMIAEISPIHILQRTERFRDRICSLIRSPVRDGFHGEESSDRPGILLHSKSMGTTGFEGSSGGLGSGGLLPRRV